LDFIAFTKSILEHLNNATSDGQPRRDRLTWCLDEVIEALRNSLWVHLGVTLPASHVSGARLAPLKHLPVRTLVKLIEITQETRGNVGRFIAPAALLEAWTANFVRLARL
jgi:hypothetical protein